MIFYICLALLVGAIIWRICDDWSDGAIFAIFISVILVLVCVGVIATEFIGADAKVAEYKAGYEVLNYQVKNNFYENDNELGKLQLMQMATNWNRDLSYYQNIQDDFWIGIFVPNIYNQFEFVDYSYVS